MATIKKCTCLHSFQDERYGFLKRVHNFARKANAGAGGHRCTVCLDVKRAGGAAPGSEEERDALAQ